MSKHPLLRALRLDKMTLAALEATRLLYLEGRAEEIPLWQMVKVPLDELEQRARAIAAPIATAVPAAKVEAVPCFSVTGGGSLPGEEIPSWGVVVTHPERSAAELERGLRRAERPVIARVENDAVLLDLRTVPPSEDERLTRALSKALA